LGPIDSTVLFLGPAFLGIGIVAVFALFLFLGAACYWDAGDLSTVWRGRSRRFG
jgi:hypothetical protein